MTPKTFISSDNLSADWKRAFNTFGATPKQSFDYLVAESQSDHQNQLVVIECCGAFSLFEIQGRVAHCLMEGTGALIHDPSKFSSSEFLSRTIEALNVEALHIPLLYSDLEIASALLNENRGKTLIRRPSPVINFPNDMLAMHQRCEARLGSRFRRRVKKAKNAGIAFSMRTGDEAVSIMAQIEQKSWKASLAQDMFSRGQFDTYASLLKTGGASLAVAEVYHEPIAYRIDSIVKDTLFALKWSFDEKWKSISPGFALMVLELPRHCERFGITLVDLYGAPDQLKDKIATDARARVELVWPEGTIADGILAERLEHDTRMREAYSRKLGLKTTYESMDEKET